MADTDTTVAGGPVPDGDAEFIPAPSRWRRWVVVLLGVAFVLVLIAGAAGIWLYRQINPSGPAGPEVTVEIPTGSSVARIAAILDHEGVITSARVFRLYLRVTGADDGFQAGEYTLRRNQAMGDVADILERGPQIVYVRLTIPEGYTVSQIADRVGKLPGRSAERFLELARSGSVRSRFQPEGSTSLEGLLLAETYNFDEREDEAAILRRMVESFERAATQFGYEDAQTKVGLSPYEAVIVASLIEREAKVPGDRGQISRVIHNRLDRGMTLGIDATVLYGLGRTSGGLTRSDLEKDTPYNTRIRAGLPPTPIASPGPESLQAALEPTPGPWLFYVIADSSGAHKFTTTLAEHNRAAQEARAKGLL